MASHRGLLPTSKEIVLEIQLNKLIHDFLFSGGDSSSTSSLGDGDAEVQDASWNAGMRPASLQKQPWKLEANTSRQMDNPSPPSLRKACLAENVGIHPSATGANEASSIVPSVSDMRSPGACLTNAADKCKDTDDQNINKCLARPPLSEDARLHISEQTFNPCDTNPPQHTNKMKVFRLSRAHSVAGSLLCFTMERRVEDKEKDPKGIATGSLKLTRIGSLPCHSELHRKEAKHTCKKPPRPPRSTLEKSPQSVLHGHASNDAILVLRGTSRRARLERRRRQSGSSSSNTYIWALILTLFFVLAMLGEGFWSVNSPLAKTDQGINSSTASLNTKLNDGMPWLERTPDSGTTYISSQLEKEMQMREFWMSKGLDPS